MPRYRICKSFTVESGHMLSKHPERCRFPHGHTRRIEIVVSSAVLNGSDMVVDFKALSLAAGKFVQRYDHAMALNSEDPLLPEILKIYPESAIVFEECDPTTEVIAQNLYEHLSHQLAQGCTFPSEAGHEYQIPGGSVALERVRVWETPSSWAEYGE